MRQRSSGQLRRRGRHLLVAAVLVTATVSCWDREPVQRKVLSSGREIPILSMQIGYLTDGGRALTLVYESQEFSDKAALSDELRDVWADLRLEAEKENVRVVSITAQSPPVGLLSRRRTASFTIERNVDGTWGRR
jgi:hypothetical protein